MGISAGTSYCMRSVVTTHTARLPHPISTDIPPAMPPPFGSAGILLHILQPERQHSMNVLPRGAQCLMLVHPLKGSVKVPCSLFGLLESLRTLAADPSTETSSSPSGATWGAVWMFVPTAVTSFRPFPTKVPRGDPWFPRTDTFVSERADQPTHSYGGLCPASQQGAGEKSALQCLRREVREP